MRVCEVQTEGFNVSGRACKLWNRNFDPLGAIQTRVNAALLLYPRNVTSRGFSYEPPANRMKQ